MRNLVRMATALGAVAAAAAVLSACGDTIQDQPISRNALEPIVLQHAYPVYWLGTQFERLSITEAAHDPSGAYTIHYGDCTVGGQYTCVTPITIVTSPDNSFVPGGPGALPTIDLRGIRARLAQAGATILIPTGGVVVSVYAKDAAQARTAALTMVPINRVGVPEAPLPAPQPNTGFASEPLASQEPQLVRVPGMSIKPVAREQR